MASQIKVGEQDNNKRAIIFYIWAFPVDRAQNCAVLCSIATQRSDPQQRKLSMLRFTSPYSMLWRLYCHLG